MEVSYNVCSEHSISFKFSPNNLVSIGTIPAKFRYATSNGLKVIDATYTSAIADQSADIRNYFFYLYDRKHTLSSLKFIISAFQNALK